MSVGSYGMGYVAPSEVIFYLVYNVIVVSWLLASLDLKVSHTLSATSARPFINFLKSYIATPS